MKGFCDSGILILPKYETINSRDDVYKGYLKRSVNNMVSFFAKHDIGLMCFTTDEVAHMLDFQNVGWVSSSTPEDQNFIKRNVEGFSSLRSGKEIDDIYVDARNKYPVARGLSTEERFSIVVKRDKFSASKYIEEQSLVVSFQHPQNPYFKVKYKEGDGRLIFNISPLNFVAKTILSGNPIDVASITQYPRAGSPVHVWEV